MRSVVPNDAVVSASLISCSLCEAGGWGWSRSAISTFKKSGLALPLALGSSVLLCSFLFYFTKNFLHKKSGLDEAARENELDPEKKGVLSPSSENELVTEIHNNGNEANFKSSDERSSSKNKNFEENQSNGMAPKIGKRHSFILKLSFLGLIFIVLFSILYFKYLKGGKDQNLENIEEEDDEYALN